MEIKIPHEVIYETSDSVPITDVIESLIGTERVCQELGDLLEGCFEGLKVRSVDVGVQSITQQSPLRELFFLTIIVAFQSDLEKEVPQAIETMLGVSVPDQYDSIVTVCVLILLFYGADFLYCRFRSVTQSNRIKGQLDGLITDLSARTGQSEQAIRKRLEARYGGNRLSRLARSAMRFFQLSKRQGNTEIKVSGQKIDRETVSEVPGKIAEESLDTHETSQYLKNVEIEIHAQDLDRAKLGWAATIPGHVDQRVKMQIFPPVTPKSPSEDFMKDYRVFGA